MPSAFGKPVTTANRFGTVAAATTFVHKFACVTGSTAEAITPVGTFVQRALDTEQYDPSSIVTLSGGSFTLGTAGTYVIRAWTTLFGTGTARSYHQMRLRNSTDSTTVATGNSASMLQVSGGSNTTITQLVGLTTITSSKTFQIDHVTQNSAVSAVGGLTGAGGSMTDLTTYVEIVQVA